MAPDATKYQPVLYPASLRETFIDGWEPLSGEAVIGGILDAVRDGALLETIGGILTPQKEILALRAWVPKVPS